MFLYFLYHADVQYLEIGEVLTHKSFFTDKQFAYMVRKIKDMYELSVTESIAERLVIDYGFDRPLVTQCNHAYI